MISYIRLLIKGSVTREYGKVPNINEKGDVLKVISATPYIPRPANEFYVETPQPLQEYRGYDAPRLYINQSRAGLIKGVDHLEDTSYLDDHVIPLYSPDDEEPFKKALKDYKNMVTVDVYIVTDKHGVPTNDKYKEVSHLLWED